MSTKKTAKKGANTTKTTSAATKPAAKAASWPGLSAIRGKFDGVGKHIASLPEGKEKGAIMNALEAAYLDIAQVFTKVVGPTIAEA